MSLAVVPHRSVTSAQRIQNQGLQRTHHYRLADVSDSLDVIMYVDQAISAVNRAIADLKTLLAARHASQTKAIDVALATADRALDKADEVMDRRLDVINDRLTKLEQRLPHG
jgi:ABC-type transporter Mla subunit MlaD